MLWTQKQKKKTTVVRQFGTVVRQSRAHISALPLAINLGKLLDLFIHIENKRKKVQKFSLFPSNALYALPYVLRNTWVHKSLERVNSSMLYLISRTWWCLGMFSDEENEYCEDRGQSQRLEDSATNWFVCCFCSNESNCFWCKWSYPWRSFPVHQELHRPIELDAFLSEC